MVSGDMVYHITYYASDVYMLQKTGYIYIYILIKFILNPKHSLLSWGAWEMSNIT